MAPAVFTVNSLADTIAANLATGQDTFGNITLRSAIQAANNVQGPSNTINLPAGKYNLTIGGLNVYATVVIAGVTITGGKPVEGAGGGIYNRGNLTLTNCVVTGNASNGSSAVGQTPGIFNALGGGIYNSGTLTITGCTLSNNQALGGKGGDGGALAGAAGGVGEIALVFRIVIQSQSRELAEDWSSRPR